MKKYRINEIQDELTEMITKSPLSSSEMGILIAARNALNDYEKLDERVHGTSQMWGPEWEKTFNDVENALEFELFHWQKEYIATGNHMIAGRRTGQTTASILYNLLNHVDDEPMDYTNLTNKQAGVYKNAMRDIKTKLDKAGVKTRRAWFTNEEKRAYLAAKREAPKLYREIVDAISTNLSENLNQFATECLAAYGLYDIAEIYKRVKIENASSDCLNITKHRFYIDGEYKFTIVCERDMKEFGRYTWNFKMV